MCHLQLSQKKSHLISYDSPVIYIETTMGNVEMQKGRLHLNYSGHSLLTSLINMHFHRSAGLIVWEAHLQLKDYWFESPTSKLLLRYPEQGSAIWVLN